MDGIAIVKAIGSVHLRDTTAKDIVKEPSLLDALGIDLGQCEGRVRGE